MVLLHKGLCIKRKLKNKNLIIFSFAPFLRGFFLCFKTTYFILLNGTQKLRFTYFILLNGTQKLRFWLCLPQKNLTFSQLFSGDPTSLKLRTRRTAGFALRATQNPLLNFHNFKIGADFKICKNRSFYIINWIHRVNFN